MKAEFILSAAAERQFIRDDKAKIVFAGRSNVGKSSVINRLTGRKTLAKVGNSPGKTKFVNYFLIEDKFYFVDLPGYGYAKVSKGEKDRWAELIDGYFQEAGQITLGVMIVDIRHRPSRQDKTMAEYFQQTCLPLMVIANKSDKLKLSQIQHSLDCIRETLVLDPAVPLIPFSCEKGNGKEVAVGEIIKFIKK
ncbi:MAG: ribosome biogenesis GTP-binding protein YihA/YsxC [Oscillospiraceae bacterium]|nr:ribosome biogenesis GTP-binding protein YihA/YsxC [Oscillospiraceae bacterium]